LTPRLRPYGTCAPHTGLRISPRLSADEAACEPEGRPVLRPAEGPTTLRPPFRGPRRAWGGSAEPRLCDWRLRPSGRAHRVPGEAVRNVGRAAASAGPGRKWSGGLDWPSRA